MNVQMEPATESAQTKIDFPRFGGYSYAETEVFDLPWGLPGFADLRRFVLIEVAGQNGILWLQSIEDTNVALPLASPWTFFDDYDPRIPLYAQAALGLENPEDFVIYCVLVAPRDGRPMTMNLLAPLVINIKTYVGRQVTLEDARYTVNAPLPTVASAKDVVVDQGAAPDDRSEAEPAPAP